MDKLVLCTFSYGFCQWRIGCALDLIALQTKPLERRVCRISRLSLNSDRQRYLIYHLFSENSSSVEHCFVSTISIECVSVVERREQKHI